MLSETKHLYFHASEMFLLTPQHDKERAMRQRKQKELSMRKQNRQTSNKGTTNAEILRDNFKGY